MSVTGPGEPTQPSPHGERFRLWWLIGWIAIAFAGGVGLAVLWFGGARVEILGLVGGLIAIAVAVAVHHLVVTQDIGEQRDDRSTEPIRDPVDAISAVGRRRLLGGGAAVVIAVLAGLVGIQRYGPVPPRTSAWAGGSPLLTLDGTRLRPEDIPLGGVVTVWPENAVGTERAAVMVLRLRDEPEPPTRLDGVVDGTLVAYSRLCTHAGCAVALYRDFDQALFCPCHQATFDARRGAVPTGGPASVALPQLPLGLGPDGELIATGDLTQRPGPVGGTASA